MSSLVGTYHSLVENFERTKRELKEAESTIRRITGRDPDDVINSSGRPGKFRRSSPTARASFSGRKRPFPAKKFSKENESIYEDRSEEEEDESDESPSKKPSLMSTVVAKRQEEISRKATIEELNANSKVKARNRRMFGAIIGTLEKFQREEKQRQHKESMRAEIEQKVEAATEEERERIRKEKENLIVTRKQKQTELRSLEKKIERAEPYEQFIANHHNLENFIITRSKPPIFFLPASHTPVTKKRLNVSRTKIQELIEEHTKAYNADLGDIDEWYRKDSSPQEKENECPKQEEESQDVPEKESETISELVDPVAEDEDNSSDTKNVDSLADQDFEPIYD